MFLFHLLSPYTLAAVIENFLCHLFTLSSFLASEFYSPKDEVTDTSCYSPPLSEHLQHIHIQYLQPPIPIDPLYTGNCIILYFIVLEVFLESCSLLFLFPITTSFRTLLLVFSFASVSIYHHSTWILIKAFSVWSIWKSPGLLSDYLNVCLSTHLPTYVSLIYLGID